MKDTQTEIIGIKLAILKTYNLRKKSRNNKVSVHLAKLRYWWMHGNIQTTWQTIDGVD